MSEVKDKYPDLTKAQVVEYWHQCQNENHKKSLLIGQLQDVLHEVMNTSNKGLENIVKEYSMETA